MHPDTVSSLVSTLIRRYNEPAAGPKPAEPLPRARLHDPRHVHATTRDTRVRRCQRLSTYTSVLRAILRHSRIATTMEVYTGVTSEQSRTALRKLGDSLGKADE